MLRKAVLLCLSASVLSIALWPRGLAAAPYSNTVPANVQFGDGPGDLITSDHQGIYSDRQLGVSCTFHDPAVGGSGDLTFHTSSPGGGQNQRWMNFLFPSGSAPTACGITLGGQMPTSSQSASLTVSGIYHTFPVGGMISTRAFFFLTEGTLRFANTNYCANEVMVTHPDANTYVISTTPAGSSIGNLAVMVESIHGKDSAVSYWHMPFSITATVVQ